MRNKGFWASILVIALALCLWGYFHPYARLGFSLLPVVLCCNYKVLVAEWRTGIPKWILYPWLVLLLSALGHLTYGRQLTDVMGVLLIAMLLGVYLLARTMPNELRTRLTWLAILSSVALIINRSYDPYTITPGILGVFHGTVFAILVGIALAPPHLRLWASLLGFPAILISGSEEGLIGIIMLITGYIIIKLPHRHILVPAGLTCLLAIPLTFSGYLGEVYPRVNEERIELNMNTLTHGRWDAYADLYSRPLVYLPGQGWYWNSMGSGEAKDWVSQHPSIPLWQTVHNAAMRVMAQFGLLAGLSWLFVLLYALVKSGKYMALYLTMMVFLFTDHFLWTSAIMWPWTLLGVTFANKENIV